MSSHEAVEPEEALPTTRRLSLFSAALIAIGMVGMAAELAFNMAAAPGNEPLDLGGAVAWCFVFAGLLLWVWAWRHLDAYAAGQRSLAIRLNRFHAVMSRTNRLILSRPKAYDLLEGVCKICVDAEKMDLVLVDVIEAGEVRSVSASTGHRLFTDGTLLKALMTTLTSRSGQRVVVDDATTDTRLDGIRSWCVATGLLSLAAVPLRRNGTLIGTALLCSRARSAFSGEVLPLVSELGADLSFAIDNADRERERHSSLVAEHARAVAEDASRAKTEFLGQMSHELRTPLNAMLGFAQLLASEQADALTKTQAERVARISKAGWHLLGLVNDLMNVSRIEARRPEVINIRGDISHVLDEAVALTLPLAQANRIELIKRPASETGIDAVVDPRRLLQVLSNLLSNACKYSRLGGLVRVEVNEDAADVVVDVIDNGVGMTREQLMHVFEPVDRLDDADHAVKASASGLSLTRQLVEMMNGRLEIASVPGSGTRARLILPSSTMSLETTASYAQVDRAKSRQPLAVVLYIEDDPVNRVLVEQMLLRLARVRLLLAETGEDGIALSRLRRPDLVLLDMHLPDMSGFDVLTALRQDHQTKAIQVVAVSANAIASEMDKAFALGVVDYWTKPLELEAFLAGVSGFLDLGDASDGKRTQFSANERVQRGQAIS